MKVAVFYYSQSGQVENIVRNLCHPFSFQEGEGPVTVIYKKIVPERHLEFPWSSENFFDIFPECRKGILPFGNCKIDLRDVRDADLVIIAGQSWFLSPSIPIHAFFKDSEIRDYLRGRNVVFVNGCRNMWLMTFRAIQKYLVDSGANFVGHIVLQDRHPNLVSVITIIRWLMYGKKAGGRIFPDAGVSDHDIRGAASLGSVIKKSLCKQDLADLQKHLMDAGAIDYKPSVLFLERNGHRIFGIWADYILKKGNFGDPKRRFRIRLFSYYLIFVLYVISPIGTILYYLTYPFHPIKKQFVKDCYGLRIK